MKIEKFSSEEVEKLKIPDFLDTELNSGIYSINNLIKKFNLGENSSLYFLTLSALYFLSKKENREVFKNKLLNNKKELDIIKKKNINFYNNLKNNFKDSYLLKAYVILLSYKLKKMIYKNKN